MTVLAKSESPEMILMGYYEGAGISGIMTWSYRTRSRHEKIVSRIIGGKKADRAVPCGYHDGKVVSRNRSCTKYLDGARPLAIDCTTPPDTSRVCKWRS